MPIGDRAIIDVVVRQLRELRLRPHDDRRRLPRAPGRGGARRRRPRTTCAIDYHHEDEPLGTAGPLATIDGPRRRAVPGDERRRAHDARLPRLLRRALPLGQRDDGRHARARGAHELRRAAPRRRQRRRRSAPVTGYEEKPEIPYTVSMGVYALSPAAIEHIPQGHFDVPDLVLALLRPASGGRVPVRRLLARHRAPRRLRAGAARLRDDPAAACWPRRRLRRRAARRCEIGAASR